MRILIYSYNYHPEPIGIAPLMTELAEGLAKRGHQVRVVTGMPNYPERSIYADYRGKLYTTEQRNGVTVQRCYVWICPKPGLLARMALDASFVMTSMVQALNGEKPDIILLTVPPLPVSVPAALLSWLYSCPIVLNVQDILPEAAVHLGLVKSKLAIRVFEALEKFAYRTATKISVITDGFTENLIKKGVPRQKITCIPNWVDVNFIRPLPKRGNAFRKKYGLEDQFVVLYSGNIGLTQGLETVIEAAALLQDIATIKFVIVGERTACERLRKHAQKCNTNNVLLLELQPREQLPELMAAADLSLVVQRRNVVAFNMPSKFQLILASGRALVASVPSNGSMAKAVRNSGGGVVVPPEQPDRLADAIRTLYYKPEQVAALGKRGRRHAMTHYSLEQSLNAYEALFGQLLTQPVVPVAVPAIASRPPAKTVSHR
jgi:colanic acid biosynthesis glycosyl transferase WcaI